MLNWIPDENRFSLAGPPGWFLKQLHEFDNSLVVIPSLQGFFYRLAQRRPPSLSTAIVNDVMREQGDTAMLMRHGLIPVTTILATVRWDNPAIFEELRRRAPWRNGGWQKFEQGLLAQEQKEELTKLAAQDDMLNYVAKDAWKHYQKQIGVRSHLWTPTVKPTSVPANNTPALFLPSGQPYRPALQTGWGNVLRPRDRS